MSKIFDMFVQYLWETWIKPFLNRIDRWDRGFIVILFIVICMQWAVFWRGQGILFPWSGLFNNVEKMLWSSLPAVVALGWICTRKTLNLFYQQKNTSNARTMTVILIMFAVAFSLWSYSVYIVYKIPVFEKDDSGFFIARLNGDRGDQGQHQIFDCATRVIDNVDTLKTKYKIKPDKLPRRLSNHKQAREFGIKGQASLVIWGQINDFKKLEALLNVTIVNISALIETKKKAGATFLLDSSYVNSLLVEGASDNYITALLLFLAGYESYFAREYFDACVYLKQSQKSLTNNEKFGISSDKSLLGSINFYLANTYIGCANSSTLTMCMSKCEITSKKEAFANALSLYRKAAANLSETNNIWNSYYVEALNNLAFLMCHPNYVKGLTEDIDPDLVKHCNPHQAQAFMERAYEVCNKGTEASYPPNPMSCAYIAYNLGSLIQNDRNFADALPYFQDAISKFIEAEKAGNIPPAFIDYWFLAQAYQAFAYNSAKTAEISDDDAFRLKQFENSENFMNQAITILKDHSLEVPNRFGLTRARIHIGRSQWKEAIEDLEYTQSSIENDAELKDSDLNLLWAIAEHCTGNLMSATNHLNQFSLTTHNPAEVDAGMKYYKRIVSLCTAFTKNDKGRL